MKTIKRRSIDKKWKYIARDYNGEYYAFTSKPAKNETFLVWDYNTFSTEDCICLGNNLCEFSEIFKDMSWNDDEPTLIED